MKNIILVILLALSFVGCSTYKTPYISINTSDGMLLNNDIYFLLNYEVFKRPKGLATIPDGGTVKELINDFYIIKYEKDEKLIKPVYPIIQTNAELKISTAKLSKKLNNIYFLIDYSINDPSRSVWGENLYQFNTETEKTIIINDNIKNFKPDNKTKIIDRTETSKLFNHIFDYTKISLKNPLNYVKKNDKTLKNIILNKEGNEKFRLAVFGYIITKNKYYLLDEIKKDTTDKVTKSIIEQITPEQSNTTECKKEETYKK